MSERLHYFAEASTPVSFDCSDSDIDSDLDDSRRPISATDRAKQHARQLQLWSDEARRRRRTTLPSSVSLDGRTRPPADRQQSNLSERARLTSGSRNVARSNSAKNLRIRVTPSSSCKSLLSDVSEPALPSPQAPLANAHGFSGSGGTAMVCSPAGSPSHSSLATVQPSLAHAVTLPTHLQRGSVREERRGHGRGSGGSGSGVGLTAISAQGVHDGVGGGTPTLATRSMGALAGAGSCDGLVDDQVTNRRSATRTRRMSRPFTRLATRRARSSAAGVDARPSSYRQEDAARGNNNLNRRLSFSRTVKRLSFSRFFRR